MAGAGRSDGCPDRALASANLIAGDGAGLADLAGREHRTGRSCALLHQQLPSRVGAGGGAVAHFQPRLKTRRKRTAAGKVGRTTALLRHAGHPNIARRFASPWWAAVEGVHRDGGFGEYPPPAVLPNTVEGRGEGGTLAKRARRPSSWRCGVRHKLLKIRRHCS